MQEICFSKFLNGRRIICLSSPPGATWKIDLPRPRLGGLFRALAMNHHHHHHD